MNSVYIVSMIQVDGGDVMVWGIHFGLVSTKWASFKDYLSIITNHGQAFHEHSVFLFILIFGTAVPHSVYYISYYKGTSFTLVEWLLWSRLSKYSWI